LVILDCQYEFQTEAPYEAFYDFSEEQVKIVLSRYNGTNDAATEYGNICYQYFQMFQSFNP